MTIDFLWSDLVRIADLMIWTATTDLINSKVFCYKYELTIGYLEWSDRAVSETSQTFENTFFGKVMREKTIGPWGPNIWLTDRMGILT